MGEADAETIQISVADQILRVRATPDDRDRFERAAAAVNAIIKDIVSGGGVVAGPRLMAMVAFELGVTLEEAREALAEAKGNEREARERITDLIKRIEVHTKGPKAG